MDISKACEIFHALSQETRLKTFRLLVQAGADGVPAGFLSDSLDVPHNTMSFHLAHLSKSGIVSSRREGRFVIYAVDYEAVAELIEFLVRDCCSMRFTGVRDSNVAAALVQGLQDTERAPAAVEN